MYNWLLITDWFRLNWLISWSINLLNTSPERSSTVANVDKLWIDAFVSLRNVNVLAWEYKTPESETTNCCKCKSIRVCSLDWIVFCSCCLICLPCLVMTGIVDYGQVWLLLDGWIDRSVDGPVGCVKFEVDDDNDVLFDRFVWFILLLAAVCIDGSMEVGGGWIDELLLMSFDDWEEGWVDFLLLFVETVVQFDELLSMIDESFDVCWCVWLIWLLLFVVCWLFADWQDKTRQWEQIKYGNWID